MKLWDVATRQNIVTLRHGDWVHAVSFSPDGTTLASVSASDEPSEDGTVELWDVSGLMEVRLEATAGIDLPDPNLRTAIATALGKSSSASIVRGNMAALPHLEARNANISNLTGLEFATNLTRLQLYSNNISDLSVLAELTNLTRLELWNNSISDISSLIENTGLGSGDEVYV